MVVVLLPNACLSFSLLIFQSSANVRQKYGVWFQIDQFCVHSRRYLCLCIKLRSDKFSETLGSLEFANLQIEGIRFYL